MHTRTVVSMAVNGNDDGNDGVAVADCDGDDAAKKT